MTCTIMMQEKFLFFPHRPPMQTGHALAAGFLFDIYYSQAYVSRHLNGKHTWHKGHKGSSK